MALVGKVKWSFRREAVLNIPKGRSMELLAGFFLSLRRPQFLPAG